MTPPRGSGGGRARTEGPSRPGEREAAHAGGAAGGGDLAGRLSPEEKQLLLLRNELYGGSWDEMVADLRHRLERKPHVFRLMNRIEDDLARIERLRSIEEERGIDLGAFSER